MSQLVEALGTLKMEYRSPECIDPPKAAAPEPVPMEMTDVLPQEIPQVVESERRLLKVVPSVSLPPDDAPLRDMTVTDVAAPGPPHAAVPDKARPTHHIDIESARSVRVQVSLPPRLASLTDTESLGAEKFRALAMRLQHIRQLRELKSVQVTSSMVNEGKTLVSANLAVTLAKYSGCKTLLIEGDLRRPALASLFGLRDLPGLSEWCPEQGRTITDFLYRLPEMPLWFLPAGKVSLQPSEILQSPRFVEAFARLTSWFDWIVVDSTSMLPIVDANLWSRLVDGTIVVIREGVTPLKILKKGLQALDNPKLVGVVFNEAKEFGGINYGRHFYGGVEQG